MTLDEIKATLPPDYQQALTMLIREQMANAYARGRDANSWTALFRGMAKSWTSWLGWFLIVAYPAIEPSITPIMIDLLGDRWNRIAVPILGAVVLVLRMRTTESLEAKGAKNA